MAFATFFRQQFFSSAARSLGALVVLSVGSAQFLTAATYYVAPNGSDSANGSSSAPFRNIQRAADVVSPGDTVIIRNGTYTGGSEAVAEIGRSGSSSQWITFKAENQWGAILDGRNNATRHGLILESGLGYVRFEGLQIQGTEGGGFSASENTHDILYYRNLVHHIGRNCTDTEGGQVGFRDKETSSRMVYDSNVLHTIGRLRPSEGCNNLSTDNYKNHDHGLYLRGSNLIVINNVFYNMRSGWAIQSAQGADNWVVANNTFAFPNPDREGHIVLWEDNANIVIANNIFYEPRVAAVYLNPCSGKSGVVMRNNISTVDMMAASGGSSSCSGVTLANNRLSTNPAMVNPAQFNFKLSATSPAINQADAAISPSLDHDGKPRPQNGGFDIGAFEFGTAPTVISQCDVNNDSVVNVADVQSLINLILQAGNGPPTVGDLTGDGVVNVSDLQTLVNAVIGVSSCPS
ncbi:MAG: choice-of-anchor Q domain-containing protein [Bryobacterales bacterium]